MAKILLVEDEVNIASFIERGLKEFGHRGQFLHGALLIDTDTLYCIMFL